MTNTVREKFNRLLDSAREASETIDDIDNGGVDWGRSIYKAKLAGKVGFKLIILGVVIVAFSHNRYVGEFGCSLVIGGGISCGIGYACSLLMSLTAK